MHIRGMVKAESRLRVSITEWITGDDIELTLTKRLAKTPRIIDRITGDLTKETINSLALADLPFSFCR